MITYSPRRQKPSLRHCILLTSLVLGHKLSLRKFVQDKTRCTGYFALGKAATDFRSQSLTCIGNQQTAKMATTTMTIRVTLFLPLRLSADTWPPGAAPRHSRSSSHRYKAQISAKGVTYDVAKKVICTQRTDICQSCEQMLLRLRTISHFAILRLPFCHLRR